ncbi:unnamed protein product [Effrenium voratum]|nr:unnamed protein product [Effrenium voratum]
MLFSQRLAQYLPPWLLRMSTFGHLERLLVFALDEISMEERRVAQRADGGWCWESRSGKRKMHC